MSAGGEGSGGEQASPYSVNFLDDVCSAELFLDKI